MLYCTILYLSTQLVMQVSSRPDSALLKLPVMQMSQQVSLRWCICDISCALCCCTWICCWKSPPEAPLPPEKSRPPDGEEKEPSLMVSLSPAEYDLL